MCACSSGLRVMFTSAVLFLLLVKCAGGQEMLENARCNHYPDRGTCEDRGFTTKWYYDRYAHRCREFYYGGCGGNDNRFDSLEECSRACKYESPEDPRRRCALPHDPGTCAGDFERWHFDIRIRQCICSWWSGCGGNGNLFYSYDHCMSICGIFADNRTSATKMAARRSIHNPQSNQVCPFAKTGTTLVEGRQYRNLFASGGDRRVYRYRLQYNTPYPLKRGRPSHRQNGQQQTGSGTQQLNGRFQHHHHHHHHDHYGAPQQRSQVASNHYGHQQRQQHPGQPHRTTYLIARRNGRLVKTANGRWMTRARWEQIKAQQAQQQQDRGRSRQQASYFRPQQVPQSQPGRQAGYQPPPQEQATYAREAIEAQERQRLQAQQQRAEAYERQRQVYERQRAEVLRERERLIQQQRHEEYQRAVRYQQELQRYQQAVQAAQNRVPKERVGERETWAQQLSPQRQYGVQPGYGQTGTIAPSPIYGRPTTMDARTREEMRRAKLKLKKRQKFEKLKQLEKMRRLYKTTPRPVTAAPTPPLQPQSWHQQQQPQPWPEQPSYHQPQQPQDRPEQETQLQQPQTQDWPKEAAVAPPAQSVQPKQDDRRTWPDSGYGSEQAYYTPAQQEPQHGIQQQQQQQLQQQQQYPPQPDPYQALYDRGSGQRVQSPTVASTYSTAITEPTTAITQPDVKPVTELLDIRRNHVNSGLEPDQSTAESESTGYRDRIQPDAERLPYGMVVAADQLPDREGGIRHAETISAGPPPTEGLGQGKQIVAIGDYEDDEHYSDDEGYRTDDDYQRSTISEDGTTTEQLTIPPTLQPLSPLLPSPSTAEDTTTTDVTTSMQPPETVTTTTTTTVKPELSTEPVMPVVSSPLPITISLEPTPVVPDAEQVDEDRDAEELESAGGGEEDEEDEYEDSEELLFWRPQGSRSGRDADYSYYVDDLPDATATEQDTT